MTSNDTQSYDVSGKSSLMTFEGHLEILRRMLFRIIVMVAAFGCIIFYFKDYVFNIILAPLRSDFCTFRLIENCINGIGWNFKFNHQEISLISTDLSAQFMTHISVTCLLAILMASPYIVFELFRFIIPGLYERERKYSYFISLIIYFCFLAGLLMSYFMVFPISFRFLVAYQVSDLIKSEITIDSYVSTLMSIAFAMGVVFQLPVIACIVGKMGLINYVHLKKYRAHVFIIIMIIAAIITPPDIFTLLLVTFPVYLLYEFSILVLKRIHNRT